MISADLTCPTSVDWNPVAASSAESAVAAVLAGFVFSGIVVILSTASTSRRFEAAQALKLLFIAFLGLGVTSYLLANNAGSQTCARANTLVVVAGGPLGTFSALMLASLTWLVAAYGGAFVDVLKLLRRLIYITAALVILLLCTSSQYYVSAELGRHGPVSLVFASAFIYGIGGALIVTGLAVLIRSHWIRLRGLDKRGRETRSGSSNMQAYMLGRWKKEVDLCFTAALIYLAVVGAHAAFVIGAPRDWYGPMSATLVYLTALASITFPVPVFILAARALADSNVSRVSGTESLTAQGLRHHDNNGRVRRYPLERPENGVRKRTPPMVG